MEFKKIVKTGYFKIFIFALVIFGLSWFLFRQPTIKDLNLTNLNSNSATIVWSSDSQYVGKILLSSNPINQSLNFNDKNDFVYYDERDIHEVESNVYKRNDKLEKRYTHYVVLRDLTPETKYYLAIQNGFKVYVPLVNSFNTLPVVSQIQSPDPVYGRILDQNGETFKEGFVIFWSQNDSGTSQMMSSLIAPDGSYSFDIQNLQTDSLDNPFAQTPDDSEVLNFVSVSNSVERNTIFASPDYDQPVPTNVVITDERQANSLIQNAYARIISDDEYDMIQNHTKPDKPAATEKPRKGGEQEGDGNSNDDKKKKSDPCAGARASGIDAAIRSCESATNGGGVSLTSIPSLASTPKATSGSGSGKGGNGGGGTATQSPANIPSCANYADSKARDLCNNGYIPAITKIPTKTPVITIITTPDITKVKNPFATPPKGSSYKACSNRTGAGGEPMHHQYSCSGDSCTDLGESIGGCDYSTSYPFNSSVMHPTATPALKCNYKDSGMQLACEEGKIPPTSIPTPNPADKCSMYQEGTAAMGYCRANLAGTPTQIPTLYKVTFTITPKPTENCSVYMSETGRDLCHARNDLITKIMSDGQKCGGLYGSCNNCKSGASYTSGGATYCGKESELPKLPSGSSCDGILESNVCDRCDGGVSYDAGWGQRKCGSKPGPTLKPTLEDCDLEDNLADKNACKARNASLFPTKTATFTPRPQIEDCSGKGGVERVACENRNAALAGGTFLPTTTYKTPVIEKTPFPNNKQCGGGVYDKIYGNSCDQCEGGKIRTTEYGSQYCDNTSTVTYTPAKTSTPQPTKEDCSRFSTEGGKLACEARNGIYPATTTAPITKSPMDNCIGYSDPNDRVLCYRGQLPYLSVSPYPTMMTASPYKTTTPTPNPTIEDCDLLYSNIKERNECRSNNNLLYKGLAITDPLHYEKCNGAVRQCRGGVFLDCKGEHWEESNQVCLDVDQCIGAGEKCSGGIKSACDNGGWKEVGTCSVITATITQSATITATPKPTPPRNENCATFRTDAEKSACEARNKLLLESETCSGTFVNQCIGDANYDCVGGKWKSSGIVCDSSQGECGGLFGKGSKCIGGYKLSCVNHEWVEDGVCETSLTLTATSLPTIVVNYSITPPKSQTSSDLTCDDLGSTIRFGIPPIVKQRKVCKDHQCSNEYGACSDLPANPGPVYLNKDNKRCQNLGNGTYQTSNTAEAGSWNAPVSGKCGDEFNIPQPTILLPGQTPNASVTIVSSDLPTVPGTLPASKTATTSSSVPSCSNYDDPEAQRICRQGIIPPITKIVTLTATTSTISSGDKSKEGKPCRSGQKTICDGGTMYECTRDVESGNMRTGDTQWFSAGVCGKSSDGKDCGEGDLQCANYQGKVVKVRCKKLDGGDTAWNVENGDCSAKNAANAFNLITLGSVITTTPVGSATGVSGVKLDTPYKNANGDVCTNLGYMDGKVRHVIYKTIDSSSVSGEGDCATLGGFVIPTLTGVMSTTSKPTSPKCEESYKAKDTCASYCKEVGGNKWFGTASCNTKSECICNTKSSICSNNWAGAKVTKCVDGHQKLICSSDNVYIDQTCGQGVNTDTGKIPASMARNTAKAAKIIKKVCNKNGGKNVCIFDDETGRQELTGWMGTCSVGGGDMTWTKCSGGQKCNADPQTMQGSCGPAASYEDSTTYAMLINTDPQVLGASIDQPTDKEFVYKVQVEGQEDRIITVQNEGELEYFMDLNNNGIQDSGESDMTADEVKYLEVGPKKVAEVVRYKVTDGWTLISIPYVLTGENTSQIETAKDLIEYINLQGIEATQVTTFRNGKFLIYTYREKTNGEFVSFGDDFDIRPGEGYFVRTWADGEFTLIGYSLFGGLGISLEPGWNLVGISNADQDYFSGFDILTGMQEQGTDAQILSKWQDGMYYNLVSKSGINYGNDYNVYSTSGYWVQSKSKNRTTFVPR